ncbi:MAG: radical SAM-associated putative lipoprotein [Paludibacteraceae bacterium]|nr:radical SAM-associated putative lipoprotein [Paludibacteraceae bacterium]
MKKLNRSILRKINYCIGLIFSLFGITSCEEISDKYGVPLADYQISGRVENAQKQGIKGIKVSLKEPNYDIFEGNPHATDTTTTDGAFYIKCTNFPGNEFWLIAEDIDSTENGSYRRDSVLITPEFKDVPGNNWHHTAEVKDIVITLEEEKK